MTSSPPSSIDISANYSRIAPAVSGVSVDVYWTKEQAQGVLVNYTVKESAKQGAIIGDVSGTTYAIKGLY